jgi:predicted MFS family arabinose efflux permease
MSRPGARAALLAGAFAVYAAANCVVPIARELRAGLGMRGDGAAPLLTPFAIGFGAGIFVWFALARRAQARTALVVSLVLVAAGGALLLAARSLPLAVAARVLAGAGAAGFPPAAQARLTELVAPERRGAALGAFVAAVVAGSFGGQALAGALDGSTLAVAVLAAGLPLAVALALAAAVPGGGAAAEGEAPPHPAQTLRRVRHVLVTAALSFGAYWMLLAQLPETLRAERFQLSAAQAGAVPLLGLLGIGAALLAGHRTDRSGQRGPIVLTLVIGAAALLVSATTRSLALFAASDGLFLASYWAYVPVASAEIAARTAPEERQGALMALYGAMWVGASLAPLLVGVIGRWSVLAVLGAGAWLAAAAVAAPTFAVSARARS